MRFDPIQGTAGVCVVRDAADMIPFLCGHYLRIGYAHLFFVDDGSSDGTSQVLAKIADRTGRVSVRRVHNDAFQQRALATEAAQALLARGYHVIVPFDADEFWLASAQYLKDLSASDPEALFRGRWANFVQARTCRGPGVSSLLRMTYRAPVDVSDHRENITGFTGSFVCYHEMKVAFKSERPIYLDTGQHTLLDGPTTLRGPLLEIFHLALRSKEEIAKRALNYEPRRRPVRRDATTSWQSAFHYDAVIAGKIESLWAANSFDRLGRLDVYGRSVPLQKDLRLRNLLMKAACYLFYKYRLLPFN